MSIPAHITGYRSRIINAIIDTLRRHRPLPGPGLLATQGPGGTVLSLAPATHATTDIPILLPWEPVIDNPTHTIRIYRAAYMRGPTTGIMSDSSSYLEYPLPTPSEENQLEEGTYWCAVKINTITGKADSLIIEQDYNKVIAKTPSQYPDEYYRKLLYTLTLTLTPPETESGDPTPTWTVAESWYRLIPELGAYV